jgi:transcriptional enhancer factor
VLEKVDASEHPQRDQYDQFVYRFDRTPLCEYMVQFIQKLRSLPNAYMMNSVLEVSIIFMVLKNVNLTVTIKMSRRNVLSVKELTK